VADLAAAFQHERIGVDTPIFISHIAGTTHLAGEALDELAGGAFTGVTSVLTLMEIAVTPLHKATRCRGGIRGPPGQRSQLGRRRT
jgi:predicted nucleic acid-binding protein